MLYQNFCATCHSLDDTKLAGPTFRGLAGAKKKVRGPSSGKTREVQATAEYLRQSILEPNACSWRAILKTSCHPSEPF